MTGILRGYDTLLNMVLDESIETMRDLEDPSSLTEKTRTLGLSVCKGGAVMSVFPTEGYVQVDNPFGDDEEEEGDAMQD